MGLKKRKLGRQGLEVSEIGLGCMGMSASYGTPEERDERESIATIHRAIELGCTFLDTAEVYGPYTNEELLGRALQSEYSLWERNLEADVLPALRELGIGLVAFSPLGRGFLTGQVKRAEEYPEGDFRRGDPRYQGENFDANMRAAEAVREVARSLGVKPGQVAIAWLLHQGPDIVPIPGTKRVKYLEENVAAASVSLDAAQMSTLDDALAPGKVSGPRYNPTVMSMV